MESIWHQTAQRQPRPPLEGERRAEAAVIGGGMAGILTAALLAEEGMDVVVLEADRIGFGQTGNTTAKITSQHGAIYRKLEKEHGAEAARLYGQANQHAIGQYRRLIQRRRISCAWEETPAYLYSTAEDTCLGEEAAAQERAGLPVSLTGDSGLPFPVTGALRCDGQAMFQPLQFLYALAEGLPVFENTRALEVDGDQVRTPGGVIRAGQIIFACHFPFVNVPGYYFLRMHQERSYVAALADAPKLPGMYYSVDPGGLSLRPAGGLLLVGGGGHRTGENRGGGRYEALSRSASLLFPGAREAARWSAQDCVTLDGLPSIGQFSSGAPNWWVATGFGKWGMTLSMVSALLLRDLAAGHGAADWAGLFSPQRFTPAASAGSLLKEGVHAVKGLGSELFAPARTLADALPPGHGGVVEVDGKKVGLYKAPDGSAYLVDIRCPHLGCQLEWNSDEASWDCPCHGSRFDCRGRLLSGPAQEHLQAWQL